MIDYNYISTDIETILRLKEKFPKHFSAMVKRQHVDIYSRIIEYNNYYKLHTETLSQSIYNYIHQITAIPKCPETDKPLKWWGANWSYRKYSKRGILSKESIIARSNKKKNKSFKKNIIDYKTLSPPAATFDDLRYKLHDLFPSKGYNAISQLLSSRYPELKKQIHDFYATKYIADFKEYLFLLCNNLTDPPRCEVNPLDYCTFISCKEGYKPYNVKNVAEKKIIDRNNKIENSITYDICETKKLLQHYIDSGDICKQNLKQSLTKIDPNIVKSIIIHGDKSADTFSHKCHLLIYGSPEQQNRIKHQYMGFDTGYAERFKHTNTSAGEEQLAEFISQFSKIEKYRDDKEIDIYIPEKQIGFEYNGEYYHSNAYKSKNYHLDKTLHFNKNGISLFHIFENEWCNKRSIVESIIKSKLGVIDNRIFARECIVKAIDSEQKGKFLTLNHIQGNDKGFLNLGLFYQSELVSVMTFAKRKITGKRTFELSRFCNKLNTTVIGGASKMFKHFINNYYEYGQEITTYSDLRYSQNSQLYETLGFKFSHRSSPNYYYFKPAGGGKYMKLIHRSGFMKHMLKFKLNIYDENKTEKENMSDNGYYWIYDCGNNVYKYSAEPLS
jgi:hypothetical protein